MTYSDSEKKILLKKARHPLEIPMTIFAIIITVAIYGFICYLAYLAIEDENVLAYLIDTTPFDKDMANTILDIAGFGIVAVILYFVLYIVSSNKNYALTSSLNSLLVTDCKDDRLVKDCEKVCELLQIKDIPNIY